jgi:hypothetical protein
MLDELHQRLLAIHAGGLSKNDEPWWASDAVLTRLLKEAVVLQPDPSRVLYHMGLPLQCHANALRGGKLLGVETTGGKPYWGFRWDAQGWWCHSFVIDGGLVLDSAPPSDPPPIYFVMPYDLDLFTKLWPKEENVPAILTKKERQHERSTDTGASGITDLAPLPHPTELREP